MRLIDGVKEATLASSVSSDQQWQRRVDNCPSPNATFSVTVLSNRCRQAPPAGTTDVSNPARPRALRPAARGVRNEHS